MIHKACGTTPYGDIAAFKTQATYWIGTVFSAPQKDCGKAERDGDDRRPGIFLVTILVKAEFALAM